MATTIRALILGDVVGASGCRALYVGLKGLARRLKADLVVANGENAAEGYGLLPSTVEQIFSSGVDVITSGNHIWQHREVFGMLDSNPRVLRPANYPPGPPGHGSCVVECKGTEVAVLNLQGTTRMPSIENPFTVARSAVRKLHERSRVIIVDFHAEEPEEKEALALFLDGTVSVVVGSHTHVRTADERVLADGTAYITDVGMSGPTRSVIGVDPKIAIERALTQLPIKMEAGSTPATLVGVCVEIDTDSGRALSISPVEHAVQV